MTALLKGAPLLVDNFPESKETTVHVREGMVVELGYNETVEPAHARENRSYGWALVVTDGIVTVGRGGSFLVEAILHAGFAVRKGDQLIVDSSGTLHPTDALNEALFKVGMNLMHPTIMGIAEERLEASDVPQKVLVRVG